MGKKSLAYHMEEIPKTQFVKIFFLRNGFRRLEKCITGFFGERFSVEFGVSQGCVIRVYIPLN